MEIIHSYERLSELASARLRRGVCANTVVTRAAYGPAIEQGRLSVLSDPDALLLFQDRGDHVRMNFLMNGFPVLSPGLLP